MSAQLLSHVQVFATPWTEAQKALLSLEFSRQEYWSTLPFPAPGDLPHPGTEPASPYLLALPGRFFTLHHLGSLMAGDAMTIHHSHKVNLRTETSPKDGDKKGRKSLSPEEFVKLPCVHANLLQLCLTLCDPMDCSPPGFSDYGILQAGILEWVECLPPGDLPDPGIEPGSPALQADSLLTEL